MKLTYPFEFQFSCCRVMLSNNITLNANEKELPLRKHYRQASKAISYHCKMRVI
jgi:hypothetical protein